MKIVLPTVLMLIVISALHFAAVYFWIYNYQIQQGNVWFDNILHALTGVVFAYMWVEIRKEKKLQVSFLNTTLFVFGLAIVWELFETGFLFVFPSQALELKMYSPSIYEALEDIISNTIGVIVAFFLFLRK